jgi:hypothetical protein
MSDEFDDAPDPAVAAATPSPAAPSDRAARLLARLYASANAAVRTRLVACLVRPLGPLALAGVAAGAFTALLSRTGAGGLRIAIDDAALFSQEQVAELARFVEQVQPDALVQAAQLAADHVAGVGAFGASVALLLVIELGRAAAWPRDRAAQAAARYPRGIAASSRRV